jgi:hypothetical protein
MAFKIKHSRSVTASESRQRADRITTVLPSSVREIGHREEWRLPAETMRGGDAQSKLARLFHCQVQSHAFVIVVPDRTIDFVLTRLEVYLERSTFTLLQVTLEFLLNAVPFNPEIMFAPNVSDFEVGWPCG